ncbi:copper chaperone PCu(A)C [Jidongwangia harbinensis]|uniref:copper chaperone PCu(A)C n=1 Tax=Jidongwangia harbinensis TaxID=2878561 RepID=UPI001CD9777B|nr:copper chaperone PCu(A)C [Jidongwangia harbinensis]MCA2211359.1 copper chaperone PCu(A)C [Jidongwangia harbinensis]
MQTTWRTGARRGALASTALGITLALAGCGDGDATAAAPAPAPPASAAAALTVKDPWVKATGAGVMTAAFGVLVNGTGADVTVAGASSPASPMELHEMAVQDGKMVMRPKPAGFVVKAGSTHELSPGGDHLMLMNPGAAIEAGDEVAFTLTLGDGSTVPFTAIAKPFAGAGESYAPGMSMHPSGTPMAPMAGATP